MSVTSIARIGVGDRVVVRNTDEHGRTRNLLGQVVATFGRTYEVKLDEPFPVEDGIVARQYATVDRLRLVDRKRGGRCV